MNQREKYSCEAEDEGFNSGTVKVMWQDKRQGFMVPHW